MNYQIEGLTIAVTNMTRMKDFYTALFDIDFQEQKMGDYTLHSGNWSHMHLLLCPAELAFNTATQNRHQFDIVVNDLDKTVRTCEQYGGKTMGEISQDHNTRSVGIYDPDGNSIVVKEIKKTEP